VPVEVTREPEECPADRENCVVCGRQTEYWWGEGCSPCCQECAGDIDDTTIRTISIREHLGPLPPVPKEKPEPEKEAS